MTTLRLYRDDAYLEHFQARVVEVLPLSMERATSRRMKIILDQTAFYPTAGGQQHDIGLLAGRRVLDVRERDDGVIEHLVEEQIVGASGFGASAAEISSVQPGVHVDGQIDWRRRFDFMQQHTGEHILGQAFHRLGFAVIAVHMGETLCTLDLNGLVPEDVIARAEEMASEAIEAAHPVTTFEVGDEQVAALALRRPPQVSGRIRIVQIGDFDRTACGGTHLRSSAEVGLLKVLKFERIKGGATRVTFHCGRRAREDYRFKHEFAARLAGEFSTSVAGLPARLDAALAELATVKRQANSWRERYAEALVTQLLLDARPSNAGLIVSAKLEHVELLQDVAKQIVAREGVIAFLGSEEPQGSRARLVVALGNVGHDARTLLAIGLEKLDGRGGGTAELAQGSGDVAFLDEALEAMVRSVAEPD